MQIKLRSVCVYSYYIVNNSKQNIEKPWHDSAKKVTHIMNWSEVAKCLSWFAFIVLNINISVNIHVGPIFNVLIASNWHIGEDCRLTAALIKVQQNQKAFCENKLALWN